MPDAPFVIGIYRHAPTGPMPFEAAVVAWIGIRVQTFRIPLLTVATIGYADS